MMPRWPDVNLTPQERRGETDKWMLGKLREWKRLGLLRHDGSVKASFGKRRRGRPRKTPLSVAEVLSIFRMSRKSSEASVAYSRRKYLNHANVVAPTGIKRKMTAPPLLSSTTRGYHIEDKRRPCTEDKRGED